MLLQQTLLNTSTYKRSTEQSQILEDAWLGDAILSLNIRILILREYKVQRCSLFDKIVSNANLLKFAYYRRNFDENFRSIDCASKVEAYIFNLHKVSQEDSFALCENIYNFFKQKAETRR